MEEILHGWTDNSGNYCCMFCLAIPFYIRLNGHFDHIHTAENLKRDWIVPFNNIHTAENFIRD